MRETDKRQTDTGLHTTQKDTDRQTGSQIQRYRWTERDRDTDR